MWLTDMPDVLRAAGITVVEVPGWRTRGAKDSAGRPREMTAVRGIMCHHTAGPGMGDLPSLPTVRDGRPDVQGPLAQLMIARSGAWHVVAAGRCNHAGEGSWPGLGGNGDTIGIEGESTGKGDWTAAQRASWPVGVRALAKHYGVVPSRVIGHREWAPRRKIDPVGIDMAQIRGAVTSFPSTTPAQPAPPLPREATTMYVMQAPERAISLFGPGYAYDFPTVEQASSTIAAINKARAAAGLPPLSSPEVTTREYDCMRAACTLGSSTGPTAADIARALADEPAVLDALAEATDAPSVSEILNGLYGRMEA